MAWSKKKKQTYMKRWRLANADKLKRYALTRIRKPYDPKAAAIYRDKNRARIRQANRRIAARRKFDEAYKAARKIHAQRPDVRERKRLYYKLRYQNPEHRKRHNESVSRWGRRNRWKTRYYAQRKRLTKRLHALSGIRHYERMK